MHLLVIKSLMTNRAVRALGFASCYLCLMLYFLLYCYLDRAITFISCKLAAVFKVSLSLLCFQFYLLFPPEFPIIFTHYSYFIPVPSPNIPVIFSKFYCVSDNEVNSLFSIAAKYVGVIKMDTVLPEIFSNYSF